MDALWGSIRLARLCQKKWAAPWLVGGISGLGEHLPAERALRHWVTVQRISYGTRTEQGSRTFALTISVNEICHKCGVSPWPYLAEVIRRRRMGQSSPALPQPAV